MLGKADIATPTEKVHQDSVPLEELARQIRTWVAEIRRACLTALDHALDCGDALNEAQSRVSTGWKRWLRENCLLGVSTAQLYQQLARHREEIEAETARVPDLSLRAARKLIAKPPPRGDRSPPKPELVAAMQRATNAQLLEAFTALGLPKFLQTMPPAWRSQMAARVRRLGDPDEPDIKASEILRRALSLIKIAKTTPGITPAVANSNENEALAALRQLFALLLRMGIDLNDVAIIRSSAKRENKKRAA
jgi:hypothetical protein